MYAMRVYCLGDLTMSIAVPQRRYSISKLSMVATFIILCTYTKFTEAQLKPEGRLELNTNSTVYTTKRTHTT